MRRLNTGAAHKGKGGKLHSGLTWQDPVRLMRPIKKGGKQDQEVESQKKRSEIEHDEQTLKIRHN